MLGADVFGSWLAGLVLDASRRRLVSWVLGSDQERELRRVAVIAIQRTAADLSLQGGKHAEDLAMVVSQVFGEVVPIGLAAGHATLLEAVEAGIAGQLAPLDDAALTGTGRSSAELLGVSAAVLGAQLSRHLVREIVTGGAVGGPLAPLASQLNHDRTYLQGQRTLLQSQEMRIEVRHLIDVVQETLDRLEGLTVAPSPVTRTLPADVGYFAGREADLKQLMLALPGGEATAGVVRIDAIDGMAGVGKTAFAVHAAHRIASRFPDGQLFVRLHAHTPGQRPPHPAAILGALLLADGVAAQQIPAEAQAREDKWRDRMAGRKMLLVFDDAVSSDQVRPLIPGTAGTLVLVTSRRRLTALTEALPISLDILDPGEAAALFVRLVDRPGLASDDDAVAEVTRLCRYLPLAISLLAGQLKHHPAWTVADLAAEAASAAGQLPPLAWENTSVAASFDLSYRHLPADQQQLFRRLSLHPGPDINPYAAAALNDTSVAEARPLLDALYGYHLIEEPALSRYRFHDLIRDHARALAVTDPPAEQEAAIGRVLDYYLNTARALGSHLARHTPAGPTARTCLQPASTPDLTAREEAVTWMDAERLNLHASVSSAAQHARPGHVMGIPAAMSGYLRTYGYWEQALTLHRTALGAACDTGDQPAQANALNDLGVMQQTTGDYPAATASQEQALLLFRGLGDRLGEANALNDLGVMQQTTGDYAAATASLEQALLLYRGLGNRGGEANALNDLGVMQLATADYPAATASLEQALLLYRGLGARLGEANVLNDLGVMQHMTGDRLAATASQQQALLLYRDLGHRGGAANALHYLGIVQQATGDYRAATASQQQALLLYRDLGDRLGEANALRVLGIVQQATGDYLAATASLEQALLLYRDLGHRDGEASALNDLGNVQLATEDYLAATASLEQALLLFRSIGNRGGEAEALNNMGDLSLALDACVEARTRFEQALAIATDINAPLDEARALEGTGQCNLHDGRPGEAAAQLHQALAIYRRTGSPNVHRAEITVRDHGL